MFVCSGWKLTFAHGYLYLSFSNCNRTVFIVNCTGVGAVGPKLSTVTKKWLNFFFFFCSKLCHCSKLRPFTVLVIGSSVPHKIPYPRNFDEKLFHRKKYIKWCANKTERLPTFFHPLSYTNIFIVNISTIPTTTENAVRTHRYARHLSVSMRSILLVCE